MEAQAAEGLLHFFSILRDPRASNARHLMGDVLTIAIVAVLCDSEGWAAVEAWGQGIRDFPATFLELPHGIPTDDTFERVLAVDGKMLRSSVKRPWSKASVHLVSAFVSGNELEPGQRAASQTAVLRLEP